MKDSNAEEKQIIKVEEITPESMSLEETQLAEQLYNSAGLDPVVEAGLKDYDKRLQREMKLMNKVLGARASDIKGYGESVARRVALAVYTLLNKQYGGKVGDLRSYIMTLQEERDRSNTRYDELMGRVVGILGEEYKELRTDSKEFMERMTAVLGEDLKESKIDQVALADKLADVDGLREKIKTLNREKEQLKEKYESQIAALTDAHNEEIESLKSQIAGLESEKTALAGDLAKLRKDYGQIKKEITTLAGAIPHQEIGKKLGEELYSYVLKDSKVPDMVIEGVGKFIDFRKYLGMAAEKGAEEAGKQAEKVLGKALQK